MCVEFTILIAVLIFVKLQDQYKLISRRIIVGDYNQPLSRSIKNGAVAVR